MEILRQFLKINIVRVVTYDILGFKRIRHFELLKICDIFRKTSEFWNVRSILYEIQVLDLF